MSKVITVKRPDLAGITESADYEVPDDHYVLVGDDAGGRDSAVICDASGNTVAAFFNISTIRDNSVTPKENS